LKESHSSANNVLKQIEYIFNTKDACSVVLITYCWMLDKWNDALNSSSLLDCCSEKPQSIAHETTFLKLFVINKILLSTQQDMPLSLATLTAQYA
jgi:hypothetical protein